MDGLLTGLVRPLVRVLGLPCPEDPPLSLLVGDCLRFEELPEVGLVISGERRPGTGIT
jgi:hypothetical protein